MTFFINIPGFSGDEKEEAVEEAAANATGISTLIVNGISIFSTQLIQNPPGCITFEICSK